MQTEAIMTHLQAAGLVDLDASLFIQAAIFLATVLTLNALVAAEPILFDKGSTTISDASQSTLVKVAGLAERYAGVAIEVQGHTDSEGDAGRNLTLSEDRAGAVLDALVALGVPVADLTAAGYGEADLILGADGEEDPAASRRVVFAVVVVP